METFELVMAVLGFTSVIIILLIAIGSELAKSEVDCERVKTNIKNFNF